MLAEIPRHVVVFHLSLMSAHSWGRNGHENAAASDKNFFA